LLPPAEFPVRPVAHPEFDGTPRHDIAMVKIQPVVGSTIQSCRCHIDLIFSIVDTPDDETSSAWQRQRNPREAGAADHVVRGAGTDRIESELPKDVVPLQNSVRLHDSEPIRNCQLTKPFSPRGARCRRVLSGSGDMIILLLHSKR